jgi:threonine aldolase
MKSFASDNYSGIHPEILQAIVNANIDHAKGYEHCEYSNKAKQKFKEHFGDDIEVFFVLSGTAANVLSIHSATLPYNAVICADTAHINVNETAAPETFGCKLITVPNHNGKIYPKEIEPSLACIGDEHFAQPKIISISQSTEYGTLYTPSEIKELADFAHKYDMYLHVDGARISNAAVALNASFKEMTTDAGVDILSFGGTKNGMMIGEAVVFLNKSLAKDFKYIRKNSMQLYSKMRFVAVQFEAFLSNDLWKRNAEHSNEMTTQLYEAIKDIPNIDITMPIETNMIFAKLPKQIIPTLQDAYPFYIWDETTYEVRLMTNFDTTEEDIADFSSLIKHECEKV